MRSYQDRINRSLKNAQVGWTDPLRIHSGVEKYVKNLRWNTRMGQTDRSITYNRLPRWDGQIVLKPMIGYPESMNKSF